MGKPKSVNTKERVLDQTRILWRAFSKFRNDNGFLLSSGITFNLLIGLIPLTLLLVALGGSYLYSDREVLDHLAHYLEEMIPTLDQDLMEGILRIIQDRRVVGTLGIGALMLTATSVFSSLRTALNIVFHVEKSQGLLRGKATDLLMLFLAGIFHMVSMSMTSAIAYFVSHGFSHLLSTGGILSLFVKYVIPFFFTFWMFFFIYKIAPNRKIHFMTALQATCFTSLFWELAKQFFGWYVVNVGRFSLVYGSLSTLIIFVLWVYYSSVILILGGEIALLLEKERLNRPTLL
jgi:membrane protein